MRFPTRCARLEPPCDGARLSADSVRCLLSKQNVDEEDFEEEQNLVARLVHHLACPNSEGQYRVLLAARRHFGQGGPKRLRHTLPPLIFSGLQLVRQLHAQSAEGEGP
jgi:vacuolar protein sorting-associated protein 35